MNQGLHEYLYETKEQFWALVYSQARFSVRENHLKLDAISPSTVIIAVSISAI